MVCECFFLNQSKRIIISMSEKHWLLDASPSLSQRTLVASKPTLILGTDTGIFVLKLQVTPCQRRRAESGAKQPRIYLLF